MQQSPRRRSTQSLAATRSSRWQDRRATVCCCRQLPHAGGSSTGGFSWSRLSSISHPLEIHHDLRPLRLGLVGEPFADGLADCIRPVPLALFVVFHEPLHRRLEVETVVRQHGIVVDEPLGQLLVEWVVSP